ncbi:hypothetical protein LCGC14_2310790 [marine sediment metagenome]|uniref:dATP/dGTP diphosphohydrolase N-terminal domain-containing protein n=1 Tax=marine sediment metagenome TaxID=412755 RepID=A0A0F9D882_9ZZZZ
MLIGGTAMSGRKDDTGKARFDLLPVKPLFEVVKVYTIGAGKYSDRNWEKGIKWGRVFAAMMRHAWNWWRGEKLDPEDGQHHLASVAWAALTLMEYEETHPELDDRLPKEVRWEDNEPLDYGELPKGDENAEIQTP